ncbi:MAG: amidohydrolase family protein [Proteobacteria bacterium]|nr:amidohydrolase family protein [Pseudomonadota bacterium]
MSPKHAKSSIIAGAFALLMLLSPCTFVHAAEPDSYTAADFTKVKKYDAHVHANTADLAFLRQARADGFELLSINVDYPDFPSLAEQARVAQTLRTAHPGRFHFATTFSMRGWGEPGWAEREGARIEQAVKRGALAVKVWKNVGMVEKNASGKWVMIDDPGFDPLVTRIVALGVPLIAHQAEPYNCWLPLEQMTNEGDREYFHEHPQYHMYLHPEQPGYETLMSARDRFVTRHPELRFVGAHLASLEWNVERIAAFLETHPGAQLDMAARMTALQYQSVRDYDKVRQFLLRYADRLMYATDLSFGPDNDPAQFRQEAHETWLSDWRYLATPDSQRIDSIHATVQGLALPRAVTDRIYYRNARQTYLRRPPVRERPAAVARRASDRRH